MLYSTATVLAVLASSVSAAAGSCSALSGFKMTYYSLPDNSPPGPAVRYNCGGRNNKASGDGSYANPLTMATEHGRFAECEIVYSPYLRKYLRNEDSCHNCYGDWIDVWMGSTTVNQGSGLMSCQNAFTGSDQAAHPLIQAPPAGLPVSTAEMYDGTCHASTLTWPADKGSCAGASTPAPAAVAAAVPASSSSAAAPAKAPVKAAAVPVADPAVKAPSGPAPSSAPSTSSASPYEDGKGKPRGRHCRTREGRKQYDRK